MKLLDIKPNPKNPRIIKDDRFENLKKSIQEFPQMLELRPIVINKEGMILGGNMRYKACLDLGMEEVPVTIAKGLTEAQQQEFVIKDNLSGGNWDWDKLANEWSSHELTEWGMDIPDFGEVANYDALEGEDIEARLNEMQMDVRRAIQIEFDSTDFEEAKALVAEARKKNVYIGKVLIEGLRQAL